MSESAEIKETPAKRLTCRSLLDLFGPQMIIRSCKWGFRADKYSNPPVNYRCIEIAWRKNKQPFKEELPVFSKLHRLHSCSFILQVYAISFMKTSLTCAVNSELGFRLNGIKEKYIYMYSLPTRSFFSMRLNHQTSWAAVGSTAKVLENTVFFLCVLTFSRQTSYYADFHVYCSIVKPL